MAAASVFRREAQEDSGFLQFQTREGSNVPKQQSSRGAAGNDKENREFDPFHLQKSPSSGSAKRELQFHINDTTIASTASHGAAATVKLAPKSVVTISTHEEVTSEVKLALDAQEEPSFRLLVEGTVFAQLHCSNALKNAPFALVVPELPKQNRFSLRPNTRFSSIPKATVNTPVVVNIPKQELAAVPIAHYTMEKEMKFMPVLLERKVTRNGNRVRIAVQIRSRLTNLGGMKDMTILVAVPEKVNGNTVVISRGKAVWDDIKRTIKWKIADMARGESLLVVAEAELWKAPGSHEPETPFPVLFRCSSISDPMTDLEWKVSQVSASPSNISMTPGIKQSFRLLHRLT